MQRVVNVCHCGLDTQSMDVRDGSRVEPGMTEQRRAALSVFDAMGA